MKTTPLPPVLYVPRVRIWSRMDLICPYDGTFIQSTVSPSHYRVQCTRDLRALPGADERPKAPGCGRTFIPGVVLWPLPTTASKTPKWAIPPDAIIPVPQQDRDSGVGLSEAFPRGDVASVPWKRHSPVHVLVDPADSSVGGYDARTFIRHVEVIAESLGSVPVDAGGVFHRQDADRLASRLARLGAAFLMVCGQLGQSTEFE